jgi:hypothetical protein
VRLEQRVLSRTARIVELRRTLSPVGKFAEALLQDIKPRPSPRGFNATF